MSPKEKTHTPGKQDFRGKESRTAVSRRVPPGGPDGGDEPRRLPQSFRSLLDFRQLPRITILPAEHLRRLSVVDDLLLVRVPLQLIAAQTHGDVAQVAEGGGGRHEQRRRRRRPGRRTAGAWCGGESLRCVPASGCGRAYFHKETARCRMCLRSIRRPRSSRKEQQGPGLCRIIVRAEEMTSEASRERELPEERPTLADSSGS